MNIKIIDNFLDQKDLEEITSIKLKIISNHEVKVYHNQIDKNNKIKNDCLNSEFLKRLQKIKGVNEIMYPGQNKYKRFKMNSKKDIKMSNTVKKDLKILQS